MGGLELRIVERLKEIAFMLTHNPNSPEGLRYRANRLVNQGFSESNPHVKALRKQAELLEEA